MTTLSGGAALAEPPPPSPSPSSTSEPSDGTGEPSTNGDILLEHPGLSLWPTQGGRGTSFTATATGFGSCETMSFRWDEGQTLGSTTVDSGSVSVELKVPDGASMDSHVVVASCGDLSVPTTFTVVATEEPNLTLSPTEGGPGTHVAATLTGFEACSNGPRSLPQTISFQWDGRQLPVSTAGTDSQTVDFEVPADASTDEHIVMATCGSTHAEAPFTVVATEEPALTLNPEYGTPGSHLTASGTGFACQGDRVGLLWDGESLLADSQFDTFRVQLTVPSHASIGPHTVVASCPNHPEVADETSFTVEKITTSRIKPTLTLESTSGRPGDQVRVTGDRFICDNHSRTVELVWDDGSHLASPSTDVSGHFDTSFSVPANAEPRDHLLRASCSDGSAVMTTNFTVVTTATNPTTGTPPPPPPEGSAIWLVALIVGAVILAVLAYRHWRNRRAPQRDMRVHAVSRPGGPPVVTMREMPAPGETTHAIRLEAQSDFGTQTIREVDDDHSRP